MPVIFENTPAFAKAQDATDPLRAFRDEFLFPQHDGKPAIYFTGNSLGLQPKGAAAALKQELDDWARFGVEGHFQAKHPWYPYHEFFSESLGRLVGAKPTEVVAMNGLTTNLHLLMVSFYRPQGKRAKILCEERPFPSDTYAFHSQAEFHGLDPKATVIGMKPRTGEHTLRTEDIVKKIEELGDDLALVCFGGVNFLTGQAFDMKTLTEAGHRVGAVVGFDLAHAAGNLKLAMHDWNVDFACWCSYKYLNSGPGAVAGCFVHARHGADASLPRFAGWWGNDPGVRFRMGPEFNPTPGADGWQLSNPPILGLAPLRASLDQYDRATMPALRTKSESLTGYLEQLIDAGLRDVLQVVTPREAARRGCQLSIRVIGGRERGRDLFEFLASRGVLGDWREPDVIRISPVPLYNTHADVLRFANTVREWRDDR